MRNTVCDICGLGPNGMTDLEKWVCAPSPCPKCWKETLADMRRLGEKIAIEQEKRILDEIMAVIKGDE